MTNLDIASTSHDSIRIVAQRAKHASRWLATTSAEIRNAALARIAERLEQSEARIIAANVADLAEARNAVERGELAPTNPDRLRLCHATLCGMITSVRAVAALDDPIGRTLSHVMLDEDLDLQQCTVPLGVIVAIFESRPDAVTQIVALAIKSGNAVILKGGREASRSTHILVDCIRAALTEIPGFPADAVTIVDGRDAVNALLAMDDLVDVIIPRGSSALVRSIKSRTHIPVLGHAAGVCHVYLHASADPQMAAEVVLDSKAQYPAACNAAETLLVDAAAAATLLPSVMQCLAQAGVTVRGCDQTRNLLSSLGILGVRQSDQSDASSLMFSPPTDDDWDTEYGALTLACKLVDGIEDAVAHINTHGSQHTDAIIATDASAAAYFLAHVDAAGVFHNASTRFADGYRYGLGAEVGVSTGKLHARGPVGLAGLTTYKYLLRGQGHLVASYTGTNAKPFLHAR